LRQKPSQKSPAIDVLLKKHVVLLIDSGGTQATIDGIHGNWVRAVSVESEKEGFVFDGYLEPVPLIGFRDFHWEDREPTPHDFRSAEEWFDYHRKFATQHAASIKLDRTQFIIKFGNGTTRLFKLEEINAPTIQEWNSELGYVHIYFPLQLINGNISRHFFYSLDSGQYLQTAEAPRWSPQHTRFVIYCCSGIGTFSRNDFQVFSVSNHLRREYTPSSNSKGWGYMTARWLDEDTIEFYRLRSPGVPRLEQKCVLHFKDGKWLFELIESAALRN
jgi:hypothetical protein